MTPNKFNEICSFIKDSEFKKNEILCYLRFYSSTKTYMMNWHEVLKEFGDKPLQNSDAIKVHVSKDGDLYLFIYFGEE